MANPRQRNKSRSGAKAIRTTKNKSSAKKVVIRGPAPLVAAWDKKKTVLQNYTDLGLLSTLAPRRAGGIEKEIFPISSSNPTTKLAPPKIEVTSSLPSGKIPKGYGRIVRDEAGNVVDIILAEEDAEEMEVEQEPEEDIGKGKGKAKQLVKELEEYAASRPSSKPLRHTTPAEQEFLRALYAKYGQDTAAMSRDIKLNKLQKTKGEIEKSVRRAGGWENVIRD
ncbi:Nucleolar protein (NOP16) involved in 60S ribosomal subunit biogenesis [Phaffia rhodozyma]|uniref:Nucleolar protein 16 n=1 Tax=Phaffia rhodozyma TaxID=264483 RepID=A0A0F7SMG0_PHARH|nr:Nucleolar protein (NOP16) involved in 60S ribosomal subunit biogenesis [Phaffia rhodozyma]